MPKDLMSPPLADILKRMKGIDNFVVSFLLSYFYSFVFCILFRLFMGDTFCGLNIDSIRLMESSTNLHKLISAITALDNCISNGFNQPSYNHGKTLSSLFNYVLNDKLNKKFNTFIYDTFDCFRYNKRKIWIDLYELDKYNKRDDGKLVDLIIHNLCGVVRSEDNEMDMNDINMLRPQLFKAFPNIEYIRIYASDKRGKKDYIFCLSELLSLIEATSVNKVEIVTFKSGYPNAALTWTNKLWNVSSRVIIESFANKNFSIRYEGIKLIIERN